MKSHKLFLLLSFTMLFAVKTFAQAAVDIPITVKDNTGDLWIINFGLDLSATNGIDPLLGEFDGCFLGPPPLFFACWLLPPFNYGIFSSPKDYRAPGDPPAFPFTGTIQYLLKFNPYNYPITINWDLPLEIVPTSTIQDTGGGGIINKVFAGTDSLVVYDSTISQFYIFVDFDNIIPVELILFTAEVLQYEKAVQLSWATATEINNSGFEILRCTQNDIGWKSIGFVPGFGTTTEPKSYSFIDEDVTIRQAGSSTGVYKYRLKQIDFDGTFEFSNEIEVEVDFTPKEFVLYQNYPNPFNPTTKIKFEIPSVTLRQAQSDIMVSLKVYDVLGNEVAALVNEEKQPGIYDVVFNSDGLSSAIYFYQLKAGSYSQIKKMVLLR